MPEPPARRRRLDAVPLAALVLAAALYHWIQARGRATPWIFPDEMRYAEASRAVAEAGTPAVRGALEWSGALHAALIAPAWWIDDVGTAWSAVQAVNALAFAATAAPVYLIARPFASRALALAAAAAAVVLPAGFYASTILAEPLALPVACVAALATMRVASGGGRPWLAALAAACLAGAGIREQLFLLPLAAGLAIALGRGRTVPAGRWLALVAGLALAGLLAAGVLGADGLRQVAEAVGRDPGVALRAAGHSLSATAVSLWVVPVVAYGAALAWLRRPGGSPERAFAATLLVFAVLFVAYTGVKGAIFGGITAFAEERNLIYLEPLAVAALAVAAGRVGRIAAAAAAAAAAALALLAPLERLPSSPILSENPGTSWLWHVALGPEGIDAWVRPLMLGLAAVAGIALALRPSRAFAWALVPVALALLFTGSLTYRGDHRFSSGLATAWLPTDRSWVDRRVGDDDAGVVMTADVVDPNGLWIAMFWNRSLREVAEVDAGLGLARATGGLGPGGRIGLGGARWALSAGTVAVHGALAERREGAGGFRLTRIAAPARLAARLEGRHPDGWGGEEVRLTRWLPGPSGRIAVPVSAQSPVIAEPRVVTISVRAGVTREMPGLAGWRVTGTTLAPGAAASLTAAVPRGPFTLAVRIRPLTAPGAGGDPRRLGLQFGPVAVPGIAGSL